MDDEFGGADRGVGLGLVHWRILSMAGPLRVGDGWQALFGPPPAEGADGAASLLDRVHRDDRSRFRDILDKSAPAALTMRVVDAAGRTVPVLCRCAPAAGGIAGVWAPLPEAEGAAPAATPAPPGDEVVAEDGRVLRRADLALADGTRLMASVDVTDLHQRIAAAEAMAGQLRSAFECLPDAAFLLDRQGRFVIANDRVRQLFPLMSDTMEPGRAFEDMLRIGLTRGAYPEAVGREEAWLAEALAFWTRPEQTIERTVRLANGRWVMAIDRRLPEGGWIGLRLDITDLKADEGRLAAILDGSGHGTWEWDVASETCLTSPLMERTVDYWLASVGHDRADLTGPPIALFRSICHPEDLARLDAELARHLAGEIDRIDVEVRQRHRDGRWVWGRMRGKISARDVGGRPLRMAGVLVDITDLKNVQLELERSARRKVEFLERISHEIRTPLNGVLGAVSLLAATARDPAQTGLLAIAEESGHKLVSLIDRLVELTRLEDGRVDFDLAPLGLDSLAADLRAAHAAQAAARGIGFEVLTGASAAQPRLADRRRLREVLDRLIEAALARAAAGHVEIRIHATGDDLVRFDVLDTGAELDDEARRRALEPLFHEAGNARPETTDDALGLWATRRLVEAMGGRLTLARRRSGGNVARAEVPLPRAVAA